MKTFALGLGALIFCALATPSLAVPVAAPGTEGRSIFATGGTVTATYQGSSAAFRNQLHFGDSLVFDNKVDPVGTTVDLGQFVAGTELVFRLFVTNTNTSFYSGGPARNADGAPHARVEDDWTEASTTLVSFEDMSKGSPDFNDVSFSFANTTTTPGGSGELDHRVMLAAVPLPGTAPLLAGVLMAWGGVRLRARRLHHQFRAS